MNRILIFCAGAIVLAGLTACNGAPTPEANALSNNHDAEVQAIRDNEMQWNKDYAAKDAAKLTAHYADNAVLMTPGMAAASGKDGIQKELQDMVADPALSLQFHPDNVEVAASGDLAYSRGTYTITMTDPATKKVIHDHGTYVTDYRKQADGSWKAVADIASSELPMMPAPTAKAKH
jgi:uncharacterized protein (TIGR02246 family)